MKSKFTLCSIIIFVNLFTVTLMQTEDDALAFRRHGKSVAKLPVGYKTVWVGGAKNFYHSGVFYRKARSGFVIVKAPFGAVVATLPVGFKRVVIGGLIYYYYGGVYYQEVPSGYVVVEAPPRAVVVQEPPVAVQPPAAATERVSVTAHTLNVRSGPGMNFPVIHQIYQGNILVIHGYAPGWLYVKLPSGKFGWVMAKFTTQTLLPASG